MKDVEEKQDSNNLDNRKELLPQYLRDNNFTIELNYKLWVTKGSRFKAAERCERQNDRYTKIIAFVSAYMIIINVINLCKIPILTIGDNYITTITIGFSLILLVASQFLYASNYAVQAKDYHYCALEISNIYDKLRISKKQEDIDIQNLTELYEKTLSKYKNHLPIDYEIFKTTKSEYFRMGWWNVFVIKCKFCIKCDILYYFSMIGVPVFYFILAIILNNDK